MKDREGWATASVANSRSTLSDVNIPEGVALPKATNELSEGVWFAEYLVVLNIDQRHTLLKGFGGLIWKEVKSNYFMYFYRIKDNV